ncbi:helicase-related protein, partial [Ancrocorticia populi]
MSDQQKKRKPARRVSPPPITYPEQLPVSARREEIAAAIRDHQVVIVAGETGSGKTTQLPKICMELGRGVEGMIGHTQPRRIAARSVAERICFELGVPLGGAVGYQVRFTEEVGPETMVKLMTDGILLAEIQSDPELLRYDTLIIDEAHERSLNIDFILGYLAQLLPRRPELKVIVTSATIDTERFAAHFGEHSASGRPGVSAPIVEVSGRTYPVEIRYEPLDGDEEETSASAKPRTPGRSGAIDQVTGIVGACQELMGEGPGDILVFLSGEGEIRDTQQALADELGRRYVEPGGRSSVPQAVEVLPLFSRLSGAEQHRIFESHSHRRIILATNIAETSLTVPGIRYVVDPGTARISRYSNKTKVQRLPIEAVSQASANQRAGRSGRVADGICVRLY